MVKCVLESPVFYYFWFLYQPISKTEKNKRKREVKEIAKFIEAENKLCNIEVHSFAAVI